jgi:autotransporter-associated beta strand protein
MGDLSGRTIRSVRTHGAAALCIFVVTLGTPGLAAAFTYEWTQDNNGIWNAAANWTPVGPAGPLGYPNGVGDVAIFPAASTSANRTVTIPNNVTITIGALQILDNHSITIARTGTGLLVFNNGLDAILVVNSTVVHSITAAVRLDRNLVATITAAELRFSGGISESGTPRNFTMNGSMGTVTFNAAVDNTYTGTTSVRNGVLQLQHTGGAEAIKGALLVGDGVGVTGNAQVRFTGGSSQIANSSAITVLSDGLFNTNNFGETVASVTVNGGEVMTGLGATGALNMGSLNMIGGTLRSGLPGSEFVLNGDITATSSVASAVIIGEGILSTNGATRTFTVTDGPQAVDLNLAIQITGLANDGLTKAGSGVLRFTGTADNLYAGTTTIADGRMELFRSIGTRTLFGPVMIGDGSGPAGSAELRLIAPDQILDEQSVTVQTDGVFNVFNLGDVIGDLTVVGGAVQLGPGATGILTIQMLAMTGGTLQTGLAGSSFRLTRRVSATSSATGAATIIGAGILNMLNGGFGDSGLFTVTNGPAAVDLQIDARITGALGLGKQGDGVLLLTANNTFTGDINISNGTVFVNGSQPSTTVQVSGAGTTLGGIGTVGLITGTGAVAPGNSPGIMTCAQLGVSVLKVELNGTTVGSGYDQVNVTGPVFIAGSQLQVTVGFDPPAGSQFTIVNNDATDAIDIGFAGLPEGASFNADGKEFQITYAGGDGNDIVLRATGALSYYLAEGATGEFFDDDVLIANANTSDAPVRLTFLMEGGSTVVQNRTVPPQSRLTVHVDTIPHLEATAASVQVTSTNGLPLIVERSMFWNQSYYGGHTANAVSQARASWVFAEGSQGFFDTYILVANANASPTTVTMTFLREAAAPVVRTFDMNPFARLTVWAGDVSELIATSFGVVVESTLPVTAERSMYFASGPGKFWAGGHNNMGIVAPSTQWLHAEGATGGFFNTFLLLSNPQTSAANVELRYLLDTGEVITQNKVVGANARLTINPAAEGIPQLQNAAMSTVVSSDVPIVSERSMYWPGDASPFGEGHNSAGVVTTGTKWGVAEGRVGGPLDFVTYILLANPNATAAEVTITYLREGAGPAVKTYTVPATSRFNVDVRSVVPEIQNGEFFGAQIEVTNGVPIAVERSLYWNANGVFWAGGTNALATLMP